MTRAERIREAVSITDLLSELGYDVQDSNREQQFACDLHGGRDGKPSARVYPDSNSTYCFACGKSRDVIGTVMDKHELDFKQAMAWLEKTYNLPSWAGQATAPVVSLKDALDQTFTAKAEDNIDSVIIQTQALLLAQRHDKALTCQQTMTLWAQFDVAMARMEKEPTDAQTALVALRDEVRRKVRDAARVS